MRTLRNLGLVAMGALVAAGPLLAHHDWPVDRTGQVRLTGIVTAFTWANPHVTIALEVQANGTVEKWILGGSSPNVMAADVEARRRHHKSHLPIGQVAA